jgi:putative two-component system response regulator
VEDDGFAREAMASILRTEGYAVASAANGRDALRRLGGAPLPDLIILDLVMPVMDGLELCRRLGEDGRLADIPVLIVSAQGAGPPAASAPQVVGRLAKPVVVDELLARVRQCC